MRESRALILGLALCLTLLEAGEAAAQWSVELAVGSATHPSVAASLDSQSLIASVHRRGPFSLDAVVAAPLDDGGYTWGVTSAALSRGIGRWTLPARAQLHFYGQAGDPDLGGGWGTLVEAIPEWRYSIRNTALTLGMGPGLIWDSQESNGRTFGTGHARLEIVAARTTRLIPYASMILTDGAANPLVGFDLIHEAEPVGAWAGAGYWTGGGPDAFEWSVGGYWNATSRMQLFASAAAEGPDPLYLAAPRQTWTLGGSIVIGSGTRQRAAAVAPIPVMSGSVVIRVDVSEVVGQPSIAGDFTQWRTERMVREGDYWIVTYDLDPGIYHYSFVAEDGHWFLPESVALRVTDSFGGENGVLVVE